MSDRHEKALEELLYSLSWANQTDENGKLPREAAPMAVQLHFLRRAIYRAYKVLNFTDEQLANFNVFEDNI